MIRTGTGPARSPTCGIYYRVGRELAMSEAWPNWNQGDEFRAIRDRSRAAVR